MMCVLIMMAVIPVRVMWDTNQTTININAMVVIGRLGNYLVVIIIYLPDINECLLNTDNCEHSCMNAEGTYTCDCDDGFQLVSDGIHCSGQSNGLFDMHNYTNNVIMIVDINECETLNGGCEHNCVNTVSSFYCTCISGYELNENLLICDGKHYNYTLDLLIDKNFYH